MSTDIAATFASIRDAEPDVLDSAALDRLLAQISELRAWCDARQVGVTRRQRALAAAGQASDPRDSIARHGRTSSKDAKVAAERERVCTTVAGFEEALTGGEVTAGHVDAIANATSRLDEAAVADFVACADDLLADARRSGVDAFGRSCRDLAAAIRAQHDSRADVDELESQRRRSKVSRWVDRQTGMHTTLIEADPITDRQIWSAVQRARGRLRRRHQRTGTGPTSWDRLTVDAFVEATCAAPRAGESSGEPPPTTLVVHVDADTLRRGRHDGTVCETDTGVPVPVDTVARLACDGAVLPVALDATGGAVDVGRTRRLATPTQRRAVEAMQTTCSHPDCSVTIDECRLHHVVPWQHGGPTDLANLAPLCETHHHLVHEGGWRFTMTAERVGTWVRPDGASFWSGSLIDRAPRRPTDDTTPDERRPSPSESSLQPA